jgi:hypothetical protein
MARRTPNSGFKCTIAYPITPRKYCRIGRAICDHSQGIAEVWLLGFSFFDDFGESGFGVPRALRLAVMRLAASGFPLRALTLFESGEGFAVELFKDPEASMDGITNSGSTGLIRDPSLVDLRCDPNVVGV